MDKLPKDLIVLIRSQSVGVCLLGFLVSVPSAHLSHPREGANPESRTIKTSILLWNATPIPKSLTFKLRKSTHVGSDLNSP